MDLWISSDFFLRGYMKSFIYETQEESEMDLVARIIVAAGKIAENTQVFARIWQSILKRYQTCINVLADILSSYYKVW